MVPTATLLLSHSQNVSLPFKHMELSSTDPSLHTGTPLEAVSIIRFCVSKQNEPLSYEFSIYHLFFHSTMYYTGVRLQ